MSASYLLLLLVSIAGLTWLDYHFKLLLWRRRRATLVTLLIGLAVLLIWDLAGIALAIFFPGSSNYTLGVLVAPGLPIEELFFLTLFCYLTLLIWRRHA